MNVTIRNNLKSCDAQAPTEAMVNISAPNVSTPLAIGASIVRYQKLWIYPYKNIAAGLPVLNVGTVYVGKGANNVDILVNNGGPICYEFPLGQCGDLRSVTAQGGTAGDGVFISYT